MPKGLFIVICSLLVAFSLATNAATAENTTKKPERYTLTIGAQGKGSVQCKGQSSYPKTCSTYDGCTTIQFDKGSLVRCEAIHPIGSRLDSWLVNGMWGGATLWKEVKNNNYKLIAVFVKAPAKEAEGE